MLPWQRDVHAVPSAIQYVPVNDVLWCMCSIAGYMNDGFIPEAGEWADGAMVFWFTAFSCILYISFT